jgi:hypothetical protein
MNKSIEITERARDTNLVSLFVEMMSQKQRAQTISCASLPNSSIEEKTTRELAPSCTVMYGR